jgi:hypothetical protein
MTCIGTVILFLADIQTDVQKMYMFVGGLVCWWVGLLVCGIDIFPENLHACAKLLPWARCFAIPGESRVADLAFSR